MRTMTRTAMMLATALLAACSSISALKGDDTGSGSDVGSGGGTMDTSCTTAAECDPGMACATDTHQCVAAAFALDKAGFYDDGTRWWTSSDAPTLHGTIDDAGGQSLDAYIGGTKVGSATIDGTTWSIALPAGSIKATDTAITLKLGALEQSQTFALDNAAPAITLFGGVTDERSDAIDFTTGEPVHTHNGTAIDLTGTGCPAVYKYAYLMDATKPMYGREVTPNPFAWQIKASDATPLDSMDSAYRVRDDAGRVLYDWTSISPDATGVYNVALYRNAIPALGTYAGKVHMDVRFRDSFGNEATREACWENHPMAPPIKMGGTAQSDLFGWSLPADSPVSALMVFGTPGVKVYTHAFVQHAGEPVSMNLTLGGMGITYTRVAVDDFVASSQTTTTVCGESMTDTGCEVAPLADPADTTDAGAVPGNAIFWTARIIDDADGSVLASGSRSLTFTIPGRGNGEAPHPYHAEVSLVVVATLAPPKKSALENVTLGDYTVEGLTYTGYDPETGPKKCVQAPHCRVLTTGDVTCSCTAAQYTEIRAVDHLTLHFAAGSDVLGTSIPGGVMVPASYATAGLSTPAMTWDSGDDDLPGPH